MIFFEEQKSEKIYAVFKEGVSNQPDKHSRVSLTCGLVKALERPVKRLLLSTLEEEVNLATSSFGA